MTTESGAGQDGTASPDGEGEMDPRQAFHYLAEDDEGEQATESSGPTKRRRRSVGVEKVTVVVDSGAAENVMPRNMFPDISTEETERSKNGQGFKGPGGEHIKNYGQQVMSVRTPEGFLRKSAWQVADVRRPPV